MFSCGTGRAGVPIACFRCEHYCDARRLGAEISSTCVGRSQSCECCAEVRFVFGEPSGDWRSSRRERASGRVYCAAENYVVATIDMCGPASIIPTTLSLELWRLWQNAWTKSGPFRVSAQNHDLCTSLAPAEAPGLSFCAAGRMSTVVARASCLQWPPYPGNRPSCCDPHRPAWGSQKSASVRQGRGYPAGRPVRRR